MIKGLGANDACRRTDTLWTGANALLRMRGKKNPAPGRVRNVGLRAAAPAGEPARAATDGRTNRRSARAVHAPVHPFPERFHAIHPLLKQIAQDRLLIGGERRVELQPFTSNLLP